MRDKLNILALVLGTLGFIFLATSVLLPKWVINTHSNGETRWTGLWVTCYWRGEILRKCEMEGWSLEVRILMVIGIVLALSALLVSGFSMCGTNCCHNNTQKKNRMLLAGGWLYLLSFMVTQWAVGWATFMIGILPFIWWGDSVSLAWVSLGLLLAAGLLQLRCYAPCRRKEEVSHNCTPPLGHEDEEERCGEDGVHVLPPEPVHVQIDKVHTGVPSHVTTMRDKLDILALVLGTLGFICLAYCQLVPKWDIIRFNRDTYTETIWGGLWMWCKWHGEILHHCGVTFSVFLGIPMGITTGLALTALLVTGFAMCGSNCCGDNAQKKLFAGGCLYLLSCLETLGPVIWITIPRAHYKPPEGECLYLAWVSLGFLMAAGVLQLHHYSPCRRKEEVSHNCTPPLKHEGEEERCGEDSIHFSPPETMCDRGKLEMVCLNKYERTAEDRVTEPVRKDSKRQYV